MGSIRCAVWELTHTAFFISAVSSDSKKSIKTGKYNKNEKTGENQRKQEKT